MTARIYVKILLAVLGTLAIAMVGADYLAAELAERSYISNLERELAEKARVVWVPLGRAAADERPSEAPVLARAINARLTLVDPEGRVLIDSDARPEQMENHRGRPEFAAALQGRRGSSIRQSATTGVKYLYVAIPVESGALRLAVPLSEVFVQVDAIRWRTLGAMGLAFLPAGLFAAFIARRISRQLGGIISFAGELAKGNFHARLDGPTKGELGVLSGQLKEAAEHLQRAVGELERKHAELEKLERVRKDFVINVSHELRTPLASIQGYTETLMDGALRNGAHNMKFLAIIRQNAERLASLTADLLTLSRIELRRQEFQLGFYAVGEMVETAVDTMLPVARKKQIHLEQDCPPDLEPVYSDAEAVHQILVNLLDNAIKYTPEGGSITVGARSLGGPDSKIEVFVSDTGVGIPAEDVPRLFERFYRVDKARSRELGGTGLGLAIVKHLARALGGDVQVESQVGRGSTFSFTLSSTVHDAVTVS